MKRLTVIFTAAAFTLVACGNNTGDADPAPATTNSTSSKTASSTSSSSTTTASETSSRETSKASLPSSASPQEPSQKVPQNSAPAQQPAQPVAPAEPVVVECLEGTPGPALMSDGSTQYSDWCFHQNGGPEYIKEESRSCVGPIEFCNVAPDGTRYDGLDPMTGEPLQ